MTTVIHSRSKAMASTHITTTPAATRRADTSFTGFGNVKSRRSALRGAVRVVPLSVTLLLLPLAPGAEPGPAIPDQFSQVFGVGRRAIQLRVPGPAAAP